MMDPVLKKVMNMMSKYNKKQNNLVSLINLMSFFCWGGGNDIDQEIVSTHNENKMRYK